MKKVMNVIGFLAIINTYNSMYSGQLRALANKLFAKSLPYCNESCKNKCNEIVGALIDPKYGVEIGFNMSSIKTEDFICYGNNKGLWTVPNILAHLQMYDQLKSLISSLENSTSTKPFLISLLNKQNSIGQNPLHEISNVYHKECFSKQGDFFERPIYFGQNDDLFDMGSVESKCSNSKRIIKLLLDKGCNPYVKNNQLQSFSEQYRHRHFIKQDLEDYLFDVHKKNPKVYFQNLILDLVCGVLLLVSFPFLKESFDIVSKEFLKKYVRQLRGGAPIEDFISFSNYMLVPRLDMSEPDALALQKLYSSMYSSLSFCFIQGSPPKLRISSIVDLEVLKHPKKSKWGVLLALKKTVKDIDLFADMSPLKIPDFIIYHFKGHEIDLNTLNITYLLEITRLENILKKLDKLDYNSFLKKCNKLEEYRKLNMEFMKSEYILKELKKLLKVSLFNSYSKVSVIFKNFIKNGILDRRGEKELQGFFNIDRDQLNALKTYVQVSKQYVDIISAIEEKKVEYHSCNVSEKRNILMTIKDLIAQKLKIEKLGDSNGETLLHDLVNRLDKDINEERIKYEKFYMDFEKLDKIINTDICLYNETKKKDSRNRGELLVKHSSKPDVVEILSVSAAVNETKGNVQKIDTSQSDLIKFRYANQINFLKHLNFEGEKIQLQKDLMDILGECNGKWLLISNKRQLKNVSTPLLHGIPLQNTIICVKTTQQVIKKHIYNDLLSSMKNINAFFMLNKFETIEFSTEQLNSYTHFLTSVCKYKKHNSGSHKKYEHPSLIPICTTVDTNNVFKKKSLQELSICWQRLYILSKTIGI